MTGANFGAGRASPLIRSRPAAKIRFAPHRRLFDRPQPSEPLLRWLWRPASRKGGARTLKYPLCPFESFAVSRRQIGAAERFADAALASLAGDALLPAERMAAEAVAHHDDGARPVLALVARAEELHHRLRDHRHRRLHTQRIGH